MVFRVFPTALCCLLTLALLSTADFSQALAASPVLKGTVTRRDRLPSERFSNFDPEKIGLPAKVGAVSLRKAQRQISKTQLRAAEAQYKALLRKNPKNVLAHHGLGNAYYEWTSSSDGTIRQNREALLDQAAQSLLTALRLRPRYIDAAVDLARVYQAQGRVSEAESLITTAAKWPGAGKNASLQAAYGAMLLQKNQVADAMPHLLRSIGLKSRNPVAYYQLSKAYTQQGQTHKALIALETALYQQPNNAAVYTQLGRVYAQQGNGAAAVNAFQKALAIKPESEEASRALIQYYQARGDAPLASALMKNLQESLLQAGDNESLDKADSLTLDIAREALRQDQPDIARAYYKQFLEEHPNQPEATKGMTDVAMTQAAKERTMSLAFEGHLGRDAAVLGYVDEALRYQPDHLEAKLLQARVFGPGGMQKTASNTQLNQEGAGVNALVSKALARQSRMELTQAGQLYAQAVSSVRTASDCFTLGEILLTMGQPTWALKAFERGAKDLPPDRAASVRLLGEQKAMAQMQQAKQRVLQAARLTDKKENTQVLKDSLLQEALVLDETNSQAHWLLGQSMEKQKRYAEAITHYQAYMQLEQIGEQVQRTQEKIASLARRLAKSQRA
jgi:tetratricopeptide (TPR) repeat protein